MSDSKELPSIADAAPRPMRCYRAASSNAIMASYLIASGWELHLNSNPDKPPAIWKARIQGDTTTVETCELSLDDVIDLHQGGSIEKHRSFEVGNETVTVFRHRTSR